MEPLRIHLFGGFLLERGQVTLPPIASRTGRSLFAYLVMHSDRPQQRDYLAGRFWPHLPESRARRRLSHTLWQIQDVVNVGSTSYLDATTDTLAFDRSVPFWLDVAEFDARFEGRPENDPQQHGHEATALRRCVDLYRGDFLAGYFDDWVLVEQDHYRQRYLTALRRLVDTTKSDGSYEEALAFARRLTHHDPLSEEAHQEVMRLSFLLGRVSEALDQYERCKSVLEEELGAGPSGPTVELYEKIMRQRQAGVRPLREDERSVLLGRRSDAPFVGREQERRAMVDSFERVLAGAGGVVLVEGEPGVGKTRTTVEAAEDARWRGFDVTWGMCRPGALRPYAPVIEVLDSLSPLRVEQLSERVSPVWLGEVAKLVPSLARAVDAEPPAQLRPAEESARTIEALVHTLAALGEIAPHMIVVDDVHWADEDTLSVLSQIGTRLAESRVLLMLLYRSEEARGDAEVWDVLRDLDRSAGLGRVVLSPLSVFELDDMVRKVLGTTRIDSGVATRLHRQTGGNVLFTLETLLALRDRGLFESEADPGTVLAEQLADSDIPIAPRVRSVIESRLSMLGDEAAIVYQIAAIAGDSVDLDLMQSVTRLPRSMVLLAVDELLDRGLFADDGGGSYRITHDQVRQVIYEHLEPEGRRDLHMRIALHLADSNPDDVEVIGHHVREGGDPARAASYLRMAGLRAIGLNAFSTARTHLRSAWEMAEQAGTGNVELYAILGQLEDILGVLGRRDEQREAIEEMRRLSAEVPALHGDVERRRAWLRAQVGELHDAEESAIRSVEIERESSDTEGLSASLVALGTIRLWSGRPLDAIAPLTEAVESAADESERADALTELASTLVEVRDLEAARSYLATAGRIYGDLGDLRGLAEIFGIEARVLRSTGDRDMAVHKYEKAIDLCRRIGYRHGEGVNLTNLSNLHQLLGEVARSLSGYDAAARIFAELGNKRGEAMVLANSASARHTLLGEDDRARADANYAMRLFSDIGDRSGRAQCEEIIAGVESSHGRHDEARRLLRAGLEDLQEAGTTTLEVQHLRSIALLAIEDDDATTALEALDRAKVICADSRLRDLLVDLESIEAMALLSQGETKRALALIRDAEGAITAGVERPYLIHHRHAVIATAAGESTEARRAATLANSKLRETLAGLSQADMDRALQDVPVHHAITSAAAAFAPRVIDVRLPAVGAPTGRPLEEDDLRLVSWTIDHPEDTVEDVVSGRRLRVRRLLEEARSAGAVPSIDQLADAISVSPSTIRRDLKALRAEGFPARTRGQQGAG